MKDLLKEYQSPLRIPVGKSGRFAIEHTLNPPDKPVTVVSARTAIFTGDRPLNIRFPYPVRFHHLKENGQIWMSDIPQEIYQHGPIIKKLHGNVLIGGLGLGYVATLTAKKKGVNKVVVIERSKDVIKLVWKHLKLSNAEVICADLFTYLKTTKEKFDTAYYDIWSGDGETTFYDTVVPLRKFSRGIVKDEDLYCWNENVMRGQIMSGLVMSIQFNFDKILNMPTKEYENLYKEPAAILYLGAQHAFYNWVREEKPSQEIALREATTFVSTYGLPIWENKWAKYVKA